MEETHIVSQSANQAPPATCLPKMKWYYYIIYFHLFVCSLSLLIMGIVFLSSDYTKWSAQNVIDIIIGVLMICFSVYGIIVRQMLARFKRNAVNCLQIFLIGYATIMLLRLVLDLSLGSDSIVTIIFAVLSICLQVLIIVLNNFYFKKRKFLFNGLPMSYELLRIEDVEKEKRKHPYVYGNHRGSDGWFAFLIYFWLFANAVAFLLLGIFFIVLLCIGQINIVIGSEDYTAMLSLYIIDNKLAVVFAVVFILLAGFMTAVRFLLASFKKAGVICLHCCFCFNTAVATATFILMIIVSVRVGQNLVGFLTVVSWLYNVLVTVANFIYFERRRDLFD